jgi:peroxiredoxin
MLQSEIAGGRGTLPGELPSVGRLIPDLEMRSLSDRLIRASDYRGKKNLVLVFTADPGSEELLQEFAASYAAIASEDAEVLAIVVPSRDLASALETTRLPFPLLPDRDGPVSRSFGAGDRAGHRSPAIYVTDRFGEIYAIYRTADGKSLPKVDEVIATLAFINIQCPECAPPEWPG